MTSILIIFTIIVAIIMVIGWVWFIQSHKPSFSEPPNSSLVEKIEAVLPQTQCQQCGYAGCQPYAQALATGKERINRCPPGGEQGIRRLAKLLRQPVIPFESDAPPQKPPSVARINETLCIGCTLCIQACPVDAILGAAKKMHTVITAECTGCELCLPPCPVDCIQINIVGQNHSKTYVAKSWRNGLVTLLTYFYGHTTVLQPHKERARQRYLFRLKRLERNKAERAARLATRTSKRDMALSAPNAVQKSEEIPALPTTHTRALEIDATKRAAIAAAIERAAQKKAEHHKKSS